VRHMGKRGCVGELKKRKKIITSDRILICHIGAQRVDLHDPPAFVDPHECGAPQRPPTHALDQPLTALEPRLHLLQHARPLVHTRVLAPRRMCQDGKETLSRLESREAKHPVRNTSTKRCGIRMRGWGRHLLYMYLHVGKYGNV